MKTTRILAALAIVCLAAPAQAVLTIEITRGVEKGMPIAIVPFGLAGAAPPEDIRAVVEADLARSGRFDSLSPTDFLSRPRRDSEVRFKDFRLLKAEALLVGEVRPLGDGRFEVRFQLFDVFKEQQLAGYVYTAAPDQLRRVGHQIADIVYEKLTGERGAFDTRIAYVTVERRERSSRFKLQIADSDGQRPITILDSFEPVMSPAWSPDGARLAYVSFEQGRPAIFAHDVRAGNRVKVADFQGINSAPAWSPDGSRMALVLSRDGNPEIYMYRLSDGALTRLTNHPSIDTEPAWTPDGRQIVFTSDRGGAPQIYRMGVNGGEPERVTFEGGYNARASVAADGRSIAMVHRDGAGYHIALLQLGNRALRVLTDGRLDESPSFAPNGRMILYASDQQGRGVLAAVSSDGRVKQVLRLQDGEVREPAWSPLNR